MKLICLSDTHGNHRKITLPKGDILIFAGDMTYKGDVNDVIDFNNWLGELNIPVFLTAGNNDLSLDPKHNKDALEVQKLLTNGNLLLDKSISINKIKFHFSPASRRWASPAFSLESAEQAKRCWAKIPKDTDVLVTHGPAYGILDLAPENTGDIPQGCPVLRDWIERYKPKYHIHGHIHSNQGTNYGIITSINVSIASSDVNHSEFKNIPTVINL
jgi:Icc-related predicted phosphoesterase